MRKLVCLSLSCLAAYAPLISTASQPQGFSGKLSTVVLYQDPAQQSWTNGGLGRLYAGDDDSDRTNLSGEIQLGYRAFIGERFEVSGHIQGRDVSDSDYREHLGIVELKARYLLPVSEKDRFLFTAGQFFLPTSMENKSAFWDSPYTITYSSLNSWIGEEFRPIGLDIDYAHRFDSGLRWSVAGTAFQGNDSMGALLAWRGWSYNRHRSNYNETLPLGDLTSLDDGGSFYKQQDSGTKPFGRDLDHDVGYALRTTIQKPGKYQIKLTGVDNRGDQLLHRGEYSWNTHFVILGFEYQVNPNFIILSEYSTGNSLMGAEDNVDIDFQSGYLMGSYLHNNWRYSARYDNFKIEDQDNTLDDNNEDDGSSYTFATMYEPAGQSWTLGAEIMRIYNDRERFTTTGLFEDEDITQLSFVFHYSF